MEAETNINLLSEEEIRARNVIRDVINVLDDSEERWPCGHWYNYEGTRMYDERRVALAESLIQGCHDGKYRHPDAEMINRDTRPYTAAIYIVDYRVILQSVNSKLAHDIWYLRLSHPFWGRPGSIEKECSVIQEAIAALIVFCDGLQQTPDTTTIDEWLRHRADTASDRLKAPWPNVICRAARMKRKCSRGVSRKSAGKFLDALSLIHNGSISLGHIQESFSNVYHLLSAHPTLRFDHIVSSAL